MDSPKWIKPLFIIAALYDGILGMLFLMVPIQLFNATKIALPNHIGYIQFPAMLLVVFAIMFFNIAKDPKTNRNLIFYGILLKLSYCSVVFSHWAVGAVPFIWVPFAFFDLAFMVVFVIAYKALKSA